MPSIRSSPRHKATFACSLCIWRCLVAPNSDMFISPLFVAIATLPLTLRLIALVVPAHRLEPYAFWDASILNGPNATTQWRNMGYWEASL